MIDSSAFQRLRAIGLAPALVQQLMTLAPAGAEGSLMRVTEVQREGLTLHDGECEHAARLLPQLRATLADEGDALAVGDWVLGERNPHGQWWVHTRVPPLNQLARRLHDGRDKVTRAVIVSNVDTALLVMGLDADYNPRRLERFLALARMAGVLPVVVLTKADLCADPGARLREAQALLPPGAAAVAVNALGDEPRQALAPWLGVGQTLVLLGSSGAGKSTLTNSLTGSQHQLTGGNRLGDGRGRHTTTARSLHAMPGGACIIDTPGLRTLRLDGEAESLNAVFDDIARLALQCRFRDCRHEDEPGCAVREGVPAARLRSFQKLLREARRDTQTALERKVQVSQWKARGRAAKVRMETKRGESGRG
jgi:ribosome biogenesis GTPase